MKKCPTLGTLAIILMIAGAACKSVRAEITTTTKQNHHTVDATLATDVHATVTRGDVVRIKLEAVPCYGAPIAFQIIKSPEHGTLTSPERLDDHTAVVTYASSDSGESPHDSFLFRVKAPGRPASIGYSADIEISPAPSRVALEPKVMDFGKVMLSKKQQKTLLLSNEGRSPARGRLLLPPGFITPEETTFDLAVGKSRKILLEFAPQESKTYTSTLTSLPEIEGLNLEMKGIGLSRFEVTKLDSKSCEVKNISDTPLMITFSGAEGLLLPRDTEIPPSEKKVFEFQRRISHFPIQPLASRQESPLHLFLSDGLSRIGLEVSPPSSNSISSNVHPGLLENRGTPGKLKGESKSVLSTEPRTRLGQVSEMDKNIPTEAYQSSDWGAKQTVPSCPLVPDAHCSVESSWFGRHRISVSWNASATVNLIPKLEEISMVLSSPMDLKKEISSPADYPTYRVQSSALTSIVRHRKNGGVECMVRNPGPGWKTIELSLLGPEGIPVFASQFQLFVPPDSPWGVMNKAVLAVMSILAVGFLLSRHRKTSKEAA